MTDRLQHKCGVFGVYGKGLDVSKLTYLGLYALQHRGQESSGISVSNGQKITTHKGLGLVTQVYNESDLKKLKGNIAIGHNRYSTSGGIHDAHAQPVANRQDIVSLAHNGNLPDTSKLQKFLSINGVLTVGLNDSELMHAAIKFYLVKGYSIEESIKNCFPLFTGAFSLTILTKDKLIAVRDQYGIRPLSLGLIKGGYIVSSETCAIDTVGGESIREILPGEMVVISKTGIASHIIQASSQKLDIFEFVYFARPDSTILSKSVHSVRENLGRELAREVKISADVVIPVPESSIPAALGFSQESKIPINFGLVKNKYIGRTFITPEQGEREKRVQMKLNPIEDVIRGKRVAVLDDSIVRGTTMRGLVKLLRQKGALKVFVLSSCPPVKFPDFYGIDTPSQKELIASHMNTLEIKKFIGADSLHFLSFNGLIKATGLSEDVFCTSCFTGLYPISIGKNFKNVKDAKHLQKKLAVLVSDTGTGTNLQAIIDSIENKTLDAELAVVISDTRIAKGLERAQKHNIKTETILKKEELDALLKKYDVDYVCLAGWKQIVPDDVISDFNLRILNIHPGLIPEHKSGFVKTPDGKKGQWNGGKLTDKAVQNFIDTSSTYAGSTLHFLSNDFDFGKVLGYCFEKIKKHDTVDTLYRRLKKKENKLYVTCLAKLCN